MVITTTQLFAYFSIIIIYTRSLLYDFERRALSVDFISLSWYSVMKPYSVFGQLKSPTIAEEEERKEVGKEE